MVGGYVEGGTLVGGGGGYVGGGGWGLQRRETLSLGPRPGKTAQKPLKSCLKTVQKSPQEMSGF